MDELILKTLFGSVLVVLTITYTSGWRRLHRADHGQSAPTWRLPLYLAGLAALGGALLSPLDRLAEEYFSAHMVQHLLLVMVAAPLVLLGNPLAVSLWGLPRRVRRPAGRVLTRNATLRKILGATTILPVAWLLYVGDLWIWHAPLLYEAALRHYLVHVVEHAALFASAVVFWWPIIEPAPRLHPRVLPGFAILYLVAATGQSTFLGLLLGLPERVLYGHYLRLTARLGSDPLDDQALAGGIMWISGHMYLLSILLILWSLRDREVAHG